MNLTKDIIKDIEDVKSVFDKYGVKMIIGYGAALGMYRDKDLLPGDDDIDICVIDKIDLKTRKAIGWTLYDLGFKPQQIAFNVFGRMEPSEIGYNGDDKTGIIVCERNFKFTIFFFYEETCPQHGQEYVCIPKLGAVKLISVPTKFFNEFKTMKIGKEKYLFPSPIEDYLSFVYFDNWRDKTDRRHGDTYDFMHHSSEPSYNIKDKNEVVITNS